MNVADAQPAEQTHSASKDDILSLIDAKLSQHQEAAQGDLQEIAGALTSTRPVINNTWGLLDH